jgi:hypothetical protein
LIIVKVETIIATLFTMFGKQQSCDIESFLFIVLNGHYHMTKVRICSAKASLYCMTKVRYYNAKARRVLHDSKQDLQCQSVSRIAWPKSGFTMLKHVVNHMTEGKIFNA